MQAAASVALLTFTVVFGLDVLDPLGNQELGYPGWQVTVTQWSALAVAIGAGIALAVSAHRRLRRLEGHGLLVGIPALLAGLLLSGLPVAGAGSAVDWAGRQTVSYADTQSALQAQARAAERHPVVTHSRQPPASVALAAMVPHASDLGIDWYPVQVPQVTYAWNQNTVDGAGALLTLSRRDSQGAWQSRRFLVQSLYRYRTPALASRAAHLIAAPARIRTTTLKGCTFRTQLWNDGQDHLIVVLRRGADVWFDRESVMSPGDRITEADRQQLIGVIAARAANAQ
jgi:hypothetical protein